MSECQFPEALTALYGGKSIRAVMWHKNLFWVIRDGIPCVSNTCIEDGIFDPLPMTGSCIDLHLCMSLIWEIVDE